MVCSDEDAKSVKSHMSHKLQMRRQIGILQDCLLLAGSSPSPRSQKSILPEQTPIEVGWFGGRESQQSA
jgi:hypothetical protein